ALLHLNACARCQLLVEELGAISRAAGRLPAHEPTPGLWRRIRRAAEEEGLFESSWTTLLGTRFWLMQPVALNPAVSATLIVLLVAAALLVGYPSAGIGPVAETLSNRIEVARSELALDPNYAARYALHLDRIEASVREEVAPAETPSSVVAQTNLETLDRFINQCQVRLSDYPEDQLTRDELNRLYIQKTAVLQTMLDADWYASVR
ncbi:MAG: hypothetical protein HY653_03335, partial [Acidobacteria bacterium]|nr:hypothetical protein [Acidobacteriota bacterium]